MTPLTANARILVVDDEAPVLFTLKAILEQEGYSVDGAVDGATALKMVHERHYDLVLTDLKMPGIDGMAVLAGVRKFSPETVTVMMTGYGSVASAIEAVQQGAYDYLLKPTDVPELKQVVQRSIERKRFSEVEVLYRISRALPQVFETPELVAEQVGEAARQVLGIAEARLAWLDSAESVQPENIDSALGELLQTDEVRTRLAADEIITSENAGEALRRRMSDSGIESFALAPGLGKRRLTCVLWAHNQRENFDFHASAQRFLRALVGQTAIAFENAALLRELMHNNGQLAAANEKLAELDRLKSQFLSIATHELRTPLTLLLGYNSMLMESLGERLSEEERSTLSESVSACKRLIRLVNSMLDLSQIQSGKMRLEFADTDLRSLITSTLALFQHEAKAQEIKLTSTLPPRLPRISGDAERLQQVLVNLIGNALKFTPAGGSIRVKVKHSPAQQNLEISVSDTGPGISAENQSKIFDEFAQVRLGPAERQKQGAGLGLAIVKRVVEAHAGQISVESEPGVGSTFVVSLPVCEIDIAVSA